MQLLNMRCAHGATKLQLFTIKLKYTHTLSQTQTHTHTYAYPYWYLFKHSTLTKRTEKWTWTVAEKRREREREGLQRHAISTKNNHRKHKVNLQSKKRERAVQMVKFGKIKYTLHQQALGEQLNSASLFDAMLCSLKRTRLFLIELSRKRKRIEHSSDYLSRASQHWTKILRDETHKKKLSSSLRSIWFVASSKQHKRTREIIIFYFVRSTRSSISHCLPRLYSRAQ